MTLPDLDWAIVVAKSAHIAALIVWCAGLVFLPLALSLHDPAGGQQHFSRLRILTHMGYVRIVTPAAVIAVAAGIALIFLRQVFAPWFFAKLIGVGLLVGLHAWTGHLVAQIGERREGHRTPYGAVLAVACVGVMAVILLLVLWKPPIAPGLAPAILQKPLGQPLWPEVPI